MSRSSVDHVVLGAADLAAAGASFEAATGVAPIFGGAHAGGGTHNSLISFDATSYLEIIAPDPAQSGGGMAGALRGLTALTPLHWAVAVRGLARTSQRLRDRGWSTTPIRRMSRSPPGGTTLQWELCGLQDHDYGGVAPFLIDWLNSPHPALAAPRVGPLRQLTLCAPDSTAIRELIEELGVLAAVRDGPLELSFVIGSPRGDVRFAAAAPSGFRLGD